LAVCDQPLLSAPVLDQLIGRQSECQQPIVASCYGQRVGSPALFHRDLFGQLLSLRGDTGPRKIIKKNPSRLAMVAFPGGELDIDTPADYDAIPRELRRMSQPALSDMPVYETVPADSTVAAAPAPADLAKANTREPEPHQPFTTSPPLTWMTCPVIKDASSEARNT
ncbi:MAG TPA: NTP transferase domain-containing protein, partial [Puia sp.]|nr:NTP transferase domain-containing protein [Puia sp.]